MGKRLLFFLIAVSIVLCFSGCSRRDVKDDPYEDEYYGEDVFYVHEVNGRFYLQFTDEFMEDYGSEISFAQEGCISAPRYPRFRSVAQMQQHIKEADIPWVDMLGIYQKCGGSDYLRIFDPDKLYDVRLPFGMEAETIKWTGDGYTFQVDGFLSPSASVDYYYNEEDFKEEYEYIYTNFSSDSSTVISEKQVASRNATVYKMENKYDSGFVVVQYTIEKADRTLYVHEKYDTMEDYHIKKPRSIYIFGEENGGYFQVSSHFLKTRPSVAWISSFGLKPYEN